MPDAAKVLAIDIGNSYTKLGCFVEGRLDACEMVPTDREDLQVLQEELAHSLGTPEAEAAIEGIVISSVVPEVNPLFEQLFHSLFPNSPVLWLTRESLEQLQLGGLDLSAYAPGQLGTDRVANIAGGHHSYPGQKVLVCDFGTTTTFDMIDETGRFLGGAICPGPRKFQSLVDAPHAAQLFEVNVFEKPAETPGQNTHSNLQNGLFYGYKGVILEIAGNLLQQAQWPLSQVRIVFTGGDAANAKMLVTAEIPNIHVDSNLTLTGLYTLWKLNTKSTVPLPG